LLKSEELSLRNVVRRV